MTAPSNSYASWSSGSRSSKGTKTTVTKPVAGYTFVCNMFDAKISSYKTLCAQGKGPAKATRPSATTLNTFGKWIEKGAIIHKVSCTQIKKWGNTHQTCKSATTAKTTLCRRFGKSTIKAVTMDKTGAFLVACSPTWKGKKFNFPR